MSAKLIYTTPLWLIANGIRYSHDNHYLSDTDPIRDFHRLPLTEDVDLDDVGIKDYDLIKRVGFKMKHESVLRHSLIVFELEASRALLQELSRHCVGVEPTVKSTRYVLKKELKDEKSFIDYLDYEGDPVYDFERASKYVMLTKNIDVDMLIVDSLENLRILCNTSISNDTIKYALPEAFKFKGQYSFNLQSLIHLLELRTNKDVLQEFQKLCANMVDVLPDDYKELVLINEKIRANYERIKDENT